MSTFQDQFHSSVKGLHLQGTFPRTSQSHFCEGTGTVNEFHKERQQSCEEADLMDFFKNVLFSVEEAISVRDFPPECFIFP